jgi:hypothetical protein
MNGWFLSILGIFVIILILLNEPFVGVLNETGGWTVGLCIVQDGETELDVLDKVRRNDFIFVPNNLAATGDSIMFQADPFLFLYESKIYLFVETKPMEGDAYICAYRVSDNLDTVQFLGTALKEPFHLSYPQVERFGKKILMVPETQGGDSSFLYEAVDFPLGWRRIGAMLPQRIKDPTIFQMDSVSGYVFYNYRARLFKQRYCVTDAGFELYPGREYIRTGTVARPGGRPFPYAGKHILPIQDCGRGYGSALYGYPMDDEGKIIPLDTCELLLTASETHKEFRAGMHHISSLRLEGNRTIVAFDGHSLHSEESHLSLKHTVKYNFLNAWEGIFEDRLEPWYPFDD